MNAIEDMQIFKRIVEAGSISKAADQLDTVKRQPAVKSTGNSTSPCYSAQPDGKP